MKSSHLGATALIAGAVAFGAMALPAGPASAATAASQAAEPLQKVDNFKLSDQHSRSHELYQHSGAKAVVILTQGNSCPIVRNVMPAYKELQAAYQAKGVEFFMLNSNLQDDVQSINKEAEEFSFNQIPILKDAKQAVGVHLGVTRTAEVFVINPKTWEVAYRGPIDDRVVYERQKPKADHTWAKDAIEAVLQGKRAEVTELAPMGCLINFPERDRAG